jgi:hypothetical protein
MQIRKVKWLFAQLPQPSSLQWSPSSHSATPLPGSSSPAYSITFPSLCLFDALIWKGFFVCVVLGTELRALKALYPLSHVPSPYTFSVWSPDRAFPFCLGLRMRFSYLCLWVAVIAGMSHPCSTCFWARLSLNILLLAGVHTCYCLPPLQHGLSLRAEPRRTHHSVSSMQPCTRQMTLSICDMHYPHWKNMSLEHNRYF